MDISKLREGFLNVFGENKNPVKFVKAPGRINLIGEHTDYNNGFVLPVAIDRFMFMAGRKRDDKKVIIYAEDQNKKVEAHLTEISPQKDIKWVNYPLGVYYFLKKENYKLEGAEIFLKGEIPIGKGLSSSAALEVATCYLLSLLFDMRVEPVKMAKLCQKAENEFVGMPCGIMDQFISVLGKEGNALFLDCQDLSYEHIPISSTDVNIIITDSGVKRELTSSPYKKRRYECQTAVALLKKFMHQLNSLRDLSVEQFKKYEDTLPEILRKRVKHVVSENERVNKSVHFLERGQLREFGKLMYESHVSLRDDYEVSCKELDILVEIAKKCEGVIGSRMTGAGFGGSTVSLVDKQKSEEIEYTVKRQYRRKTGINPDVYICNVVDGVEEIKQADS